VARSTISGVTNLEALVALYVNPIPIVSKRPTVTTELNREQTVSLQGSPVVSAAEAGRPLRSFASELYCPSVNGTFGTGGTTFVGAGSAAKTSPETQSR
jgi:hypothetical protein